MTQRIKLLNLIVLTLCLTHCSDGPGGRRMFGFNTAAPGQSQSQSAFTNNQNTPLLPPEFLQALVNAQKQPDVGPVQDPTIQAVDILTPANWSKLCEGHTGGDDTDRDGLSDDCENYLSSSNPKQYRGLNPKVFNGWIYGGRYVYPDNLSWTLSITDQQKLEEDERRYGPLNGRGITPQNRPIAEYLSVKKEVQDSDLPAFNKAFYNSSNKPMRIDEANLSYLRSDLFFDDQDDDQNMGVTTADGIEILPYRKIGDAVAQVNGFAQDTDSEREGASNGMKMIAHHTNIIFPEGVDEIEVTVAHLSQDDAALQPPDLYYAVNNGNSILSQNETVTDNGGAYTGSTFGRLRKNPGCITGDLTIFSVVGGNPSGARQPILPVWIAFRINGSKWGHLDQSYYSMTPQGGVDCQRNFKYAKFSTSRGFFRTYKQILNNVNGVADLNDALGKVGGTNPFLMVDKTTSLDNIKAAFAGTDISKLSAAQLVSANNALSYINVSGLAEADKTWYNDIVDKISKRQAQINGAEASINSQLDQLEALINDPDFANKKGEIDALLTALDANNLLTDAQKERLKTLKQKNTDKLTELANKPAQTTTTKPVNWSPDLITYLKTLDQDPNLSPGFLTSDIATWEQGFDDEASSEAAKKDAADKITAMLLDPTKKDFTADQRKTIVDELQKNGLINDLKSEELKGKIDGREAFVDENGKYRPDYAAMFTLVTLKDADGNDMKAFRFDSKLNFNTGEKTLDKNKNARNIVDIFANFMSKIKSDDKFVKINAFTDAVGEKSQDPSQFNQPKSNNLVLSQARAKAVKDYLIKKSSLSADHILAEGKGVDPNQKGQYGPKKVKGRNRKVNGWTEDEDARRVEMYFASKAFGK